jgi:peptidoglycan/LPS O-acetylase OafA/YrhL
VDKARAKRQLRWSTLGLLFIPLTLTVLAIMFGDGKLLPPYVFIVPLIGSVLATIGLYVGISWKISRSD